MSDSAVDPESAPKPADAPDAGHISDFGDTSLAWRMYDSAVRKVAGEQTEVSRAFDRDGVFFGHLDPGLAGRAYASIHASVKEPLINRDFAPGFVTHDFSADVLNELNRSSSFRVFNLQSAWDLQDCLDCMRDDVASALGSPWRILNVRAWTTKPESRPEGPYNWHSDGYVPEIFKVLLYLTPLSRENGMVEFNIRGEIKRMLSGSRGAWALFKNSEIIHRGVPGTEHERLLVDITLCRSAAFDLRARFPGQNSHWPTFPWIDATGCANSDLERASRGTAAFPMVSKLRVRPKALMKQFARPFWHLIRRTFKRPPA